jgi:hypothetical protein
MADDFLAIRLRRMTDGKRGIGGWRWGGGLKTYNYKAHLELLGYCIERTTKRQRNGRGILSVSSEKKVVEDEQKKPAGREAKRSGRGRE